MGLLTKEAILAAKDRRHEDVEVPEWGGTVRVAEMTGAQRDAWELEASKAEGNSWTANLRASLAALCVVDEDLEPLFTREAIEQLGRKSARALRRIATVAMRLNAVGGSEVDASKKEPAPTAGTDASSS